GGGRGGGGRRGGKGAADVCNLFIKECCKVICSEGRLGWGRWHAEERGENREQLMRVRNGVMNFSLIEICLSGSDSRKKLCQERLIG
ncbi:hypothetical protein ANANG_G00042520, partial [Anguilla anguilla]